MAPTKKEIADQLQNEGGFQKDGSAGINPSMNAASEKRRYPRRTALYSAKYTVKSGTYRDLIGNVSAGGIYIYTRQTVKDGQRINLRFPIVAFDPRPSVMGTVVRSQYRGFAVMFDTPVEERSCQTGHFPGSDSAPGQPG